MEPAYERHQQNRQHGIEEKASKRGEAEEGAQDGSMSRVAENSSQNNIYF